MSKVKLEKQTRYNNKAVYPGEEFEVDEKTAKRWANKKPPICEIISEEYNNQQETLLSKIEESESLKSDIAVDNIQDINSETEQNSDLEDNQKSISANSLMDSEKETVEMIYGETISDNVEAAMVSEDVRQDSDNIQHTNSSAQSKKKKKQ